MRCSIKGNQAFSPRTGLQAQIFRQREMYRFAVRRCFSSGGLRKADWLVGNANKVYYVHFAMNYKLRNIEVCKKVILIKEQILIPIVSSCVIFLLTQCISFDS